MIPAVKGSAGIWEKPLRLQPFPAIISSVEKQKCGSPQVRQHLRACTGASTTYTTAKWPHRMEYDTTFRPFCKGRFCRVYFLCLCRIEKPLLLALCRLNRTAFLFFTPPTQGTPVPRGWCGEK